MMFNKINSIPQEKCLIDDCKTEGTPTVGSEEASFRESQGRKERSTFYSDQDPASKSFSRTFEFVRDRVEDSDCSRQNVIYIDFSRRKWNLWIWSLPAAVNELIRIITISNSISRHASCSHRLSEWLSLL